MKENSIRRAVREGRAALGTGLKEFASRGVPRIIESSGFESLTDRLSHLDLAEIEIEQRSVVIDRRRADHRIVDLELLYEIKERGIYYWNENINLLNDLDKLNLPDAIHERNKELLDYCDLRIKSYNCIYNQVEQNTDIYQDSIQYYDKQIEVIIDRLKGK